MNKCSLPFIFVAHVCNDNILNRNTVFELRYTGLEYRFTVFELRYIGLEYRFTVLE